MKGIVEERAVELGEYTVQHKATVRTAAKQFGISKSTVHKDVAQRLKYIDLQLYRKVKQILEVKYDEFLPDYLYRNLQLSHLRQTTFSKYYLCRRYSLSGIRA